MIKLVSKDFVDVVLKISGYSRKAKEYNLILEVAISNIKSCFLFFTYSNSYLIIITSQV